MTPATQQDHYLANGRGNAVLQRCSPLFGISGPFEFK